MLQKECTDYDGLSGRLRQHTAAENFSRLLLDRVQDLAARWYQICTGAGYIPSPYPEVSEYQDLLEPHLYKDLMLPSLDFRDSVAAAMRYYWAQMTPDQKTLTPSVFVSHNPNALLTALRDPTAAGEVIEFSENAMRTPFSVLLATDKEFGKFILGETDIPPHPESFCIPGRDKEGKPTQNLYLPLEVRMYILAQAGQRKLMIKHGLDRPENVDAKGRLKPHVYKSSPHLCAWTDLMSQWFTKKRIHTLERFSVRLRARTIKFTLNGPFKTAKKKQRRSGSQVNMEATKALLEGKLLEAPPRPDKRPKTSTKKKRKTQQAKQSQATTREVTRAHTPCLPPSHTVAQPHVSAHADAPAAPEVPAEEAPYDWETHFRELNARLSDERRAMRESAAAEADTPTVSEEVSMPAEAAARSHPFPLAPLSELPHSIQTFVHTMQDPQCVIDGRIATSALNGLASFFTSENPYGHFVIEQGSGSRVLLRHPNLGNLHMHLPHSPQIVLRDASSERSPWWKIINSLIDTRT